MDLLGLARRHLDVVLTAALTALYVFEIVRWEPSELAVALPCGIVAGLALSVRRRYVLITFVVITLANYGVLANSPGIERRSAAFLAISVIALYSLGRHTIGLQAWLGGAAVLGMFFSLMALVASISLGDVFHVSLFVGAPWAAGILLRLRREEEDRLAARTEQMRRDHEQRLRQAIAHERSRIARELHDVLAHAIAVTVVQARGGRRMIGTDDMALRRSFDAIEQTSTHALQDVRHLLSLLRDTDSEESSEDWGTQPSLHHVAALVDQLQMTGMAVNLEVTGVAGYVPPGVDLSAYRIIQEGLANVHKHAGPAAEAKVRISYGDSHLLVVVADNGPAPSNGDGREHTLVGIRDRAEVVGGYVESHTGENGGFVVRAILPYAVDA